MSERLRRFFKTTLPFYLSIKLGMNLRFTMLSHCNYMKLLVALALISVMLFASSGFAQSPAARSDSKPTEAAPDEPKPSKPDNKVTTEEDIAALKAENAAVRELLRKMNEQQKILLEQMDRLQRRLDGPTTAGPNTDAHAVGQPLLIPKAGPLSDPTSTPATDPTSDPNAAAQPLQKVEDRYRDGIVIWETKDDAKIPFLLKFNNNTQFRYLNTTSSKEFFTDHLGVVREVHKRNDLTVNRSMFILGGYVFDKRLRYSLTVWTSAGAASIVVAGNIGWQFNKKLTLTAGYTGVPGSRSLVNTFPFFTDMDRSMADNFFRPGFTQGVWANGDLGHGVNYLVFLGNGLNTLNISANKIDPHLLVSGSVWWEPLGAYSEPGKSRNMYDDYFASSKTRIRLGTAFTSSREDRFSNTEQSTPDNTSIYNSDGVLAFSTGAFAPGVTLQKAKYRMWAIDGGLKKSGLAINGQYFMRWLNHFEADGPMPLTSTFDHGFELSAAKFVVPKKVMPYVRGSVVFGQFGDAHEYGGGVKWYFLPTERIWLNAEVMRVQHSPYSGAFTPYTAGLNGWVPMVQTVLAF